MRRTLHIAMMALALSLLTSSASSQQSPVNQVLGIEAQDLAEATEITIEGSASPTFSVYRLDRPARIFVDFSNSELVGDVTNWAVRNGLVDEVLVLQYRDDVSLVTRVVIALEREDAEYDIETGERSVTVTVTAEGWRSPRLVAEAESEEQAQRASRSAELSSQLEHLESQAATSQRQLEERTEQLGTLESQVGALAEREAAERRRANAISSELESVESELAQARASEREARAAMRELAERSQNLEAEIRTMSEALGAQELVASEVDEAESRRQALESELRAILDEQAELEGAVAQAAQRREGIEEQALQAQRELDGARAELERLRSERAVAESEVSQARAELEQTEAQLAVRRAEQTRLEAELAERELERQALEAELAAAELERQSMAAELAEAASQREAIEAELERAVSRRDRLQTDLREAGERRATIERQVEEATALLATASAQRERMDAELSAARAEREAIGAELAEAQAERERINAELAQVADERERIEAELDEAANRRRRIESELNRAARERDELVAEREQLTRQLATLESDQEQEAAELAEIASRREAIESELGRLRAERTDASAELDDVATRQEAAAQQLARLQAEREALAAEIEGVESQREAEASELARVEAARREAEDSLRRITDERESLAEEIAAMESRLDGLRSAAETSASAEPAAAEAAELEAERARREALEQELARQREALTRAQEELARREAGLRADRSDRAGNRLTSNEAAGRSPETPRSAGSPEPEHDAAAPAARVTDVRFSQLHGVDRIEVEFDGPAPSVESLPWNDGRAGLVIPGAALPEAMHRTLDTRAFGGPVQFVSAYTDEAGDVRLVADLAEAASEILSRDGTVAAWEFSSVATALDESEVAAADGGFEGYNSQEEPSTAPPIRRPSGLTYTIGRQQDRIETPRLSRRFRVTIDVVNADIQNVLRLFSDQGDVNIIASGNVQGQITLRLRDVPLDVAFALILQSQGLGFEQRGNIIRVAPLSEFEAERQRELQRIAEAFDVEPLQVRLRPVSYADGGEMISLLQDVLSSRGSASFDDRTHTLILTDVAENLDAAEQLIDALDTQTPQVLIEARIVQTSETFSQGFGIQWGGDALFSAANGNPTGLLFPSTIGIAGGAGQTPAEGTSSTPNYAVNLPGPSNGAIGFQFGSLGQAVNLNLRLSAAESSGEAKVVSAPRILTLDGQSATISTGVSIPVQTVGAAGTNVSFIQADLSLTVQPVVTPDGFVRLELNVTKNEPDFARTGANGDPTIQTRTAQTNLLVRDGETSVIGGIFEHIQGSDQNAVPFFSDIPILGALFHDYSFQDERTETLIFITPRIVNRDVALTNYTPGGVLMTPPSE